MKVSLYDAQQVSNVPLNEIGTDALLKKIGAQLGAVEEVIYTGKKYDGVVVVRVVACEQHPNADRLHVVTIDDGGITPDVKRNEQGYVQVVCGAPNVREGITVAWLPPGSTVPYSYDKDPFVLEARELRGVVSNGMLASAHELGISDDHSGILELTPNDASEDVLTPGMPFKKLLGLDDVIVDCENKMFTHRPDCFGYLGVARELAGIQQLGFKSPDWYLSPLSLEASDQANSDIHEYGVTVEVENLVPRYMLLGMDGITIGPSPLWLQVSLAKVGIRSINNIVDITNYIMMMTGQPLHAFDFDKVAKNGSAQIVVRNPKEGETLSLLDGKTITPRSDAILICDQDKPIALGGIMGSNNSEIDEHTTRILIECATFDMYNIRRTSMEHGVFTDAAMRFTKGQSPLQCPSVLAKAADLIREIVPGARIVGQAVDSNDAIEQNKEITVSAQFINERLGTELKAHEIAGLLTNVEFICIEDTVDGSLRITAPFWRTDIELPEDIVEEVGRLHGFDQLPFDLPSRKSSPSTRNNMLDVKQRIRTALSAAGANEVLTYSFVHGNLMQKTGTDPAKWAYHLRNALSPDLQYYRTTLMPSLLDKVRGNIRADMVRSDDNEFAIFEIGKAHVIGHETDEHVPEEMERVALVFAADDKTAARKYDGSPYYQARLYLNEVATGTIVFEPLENNDYPVTSCYLKGRSAVIKIDGQICGVIGEFRAEVKKALKLPNYCAGFEIDTTALQTQDGKTYQVMSVFPKVEQDMTFTLPTSHTYQELHDVVAATLKKVQDETDVAYVVLSRDIYQAESMQDERRVTIRVWLSHPAKTLTTEETNRILDEVATAANEKLHATRV